MLTGYRIGPNQYIKAGAAQVIVPKTAAFFPVDTVVYVQRSQAVQYAFDRQSGTFIAAPQWARLQLTSGWRAFYQAVAADGTVYYLIGDNGWVKASDVTTAYVVPRVGAVTVTNANGAGAYATSTRTGNRVQTLAPRSAWKIWAIAQNPDGSKAYLVADNQWVAASDVAEQVTTGARGVFQVGSTTAVTFDSNGNLVKGRTLRTGSR